MTSVLFSPTDIRLLIIDHHQQYYAQICQQLKQKQYRVIAALLKDLDHFSQQLHLTWDLVIFVQASDFDLTQAMTQIQASHQPKLPLLCLAPQPGSNLTDQQLLQQGTYDLLQANDIEQSITCLLHALCYSRLQQTQQQLLQQINQTQSLVQNTHKAIALLDHQGIHRQVNPAYLKLFDLQHENDVVGLHLFDILQAQNMAEFSQYFNQALMSTRVLAPVTVISKHANFNPQQPLCIQCIKPAMGNTLQIQIDLPTHLIDPTQLDLVQDQPIQTLIDHPIDSIPSDIFLAQPDSHASPEEKSALSLYTHAQSDILTTQHALITALSIALEQNKLQIKYQQIYDKQDEYLYIYEAYAGFIFDQQWQNCSDLDQLNDHAQLSIQLDRWLLIEASQKLQQIVLQYPQARLLINLNWHILIQDTQLPELLAQCIKIIASPLENPLILQFNQKDIHQHLLHAQLNLQHLTTHGTVISLRNFSDHDDHSALLQQIDIQYARLDEHFSQQLVQTTSTDSYRQKLGLLKETQDIEIILSGLNHMTLFANAWNIDVRFIQGDYFQSAQDYFAGIDD